MIRSVYLLRNLTRNPLRALLTCAAVALPVVIYVMSTAVIDGINRFLDNSAKQLRLAVVHKASIVNPLPAGYRAKIESLDPTRTRLTSVCGFRFIGGKVEGKAQPLSTIGADVDSFLATFPEVRLTPEQAGQWIRDPRAIVLGGSTAAQFGWKVGDRITIRPTLPPYKPLEFNVVGAGAHETDPVTNFCRRDYLEEEIRSMGGDAYVVGFYFVKCATQADLDHFRVAIDDLFARTLDETKTQDEKAFMNEFITQQFDLPRNLTILAAVTIFVAVMAAANTMSMNFRERLHEFATLKALGFGGSLVFGLIQSESIFLCALGGAFGALIPYISFMHTPLGSYPVPLIQTLEIQPIVCLQALVISLVIGVLAALWPSWLALRLRVVTALRTLE